MTKEEIIEFCEMKAELESENEDIYEAIINALEQEPDTWSLEDAREDFMDDVYNTLDFLPTNDEANQIIDSFDRVTSSIRREPCEDCISREAVLDLAEKGLLISNGNYESVCKAINDLPSVTLTRKKGKWEFEKTIFDRLGLMVRCPSCRKRWKTYDEIRWKKENRFCPNCGADMRESEDKE